MRGLNSLATPPGLRVKLRMLIPLLVAGLAVVGGVFLPYRSGYTGLGYVDGTDDATIFFGMFTLLLGIAIVILAIIGLARSNPGDEPRAPRLTAAAGIVGVIALCLTLRDLSAALNSNEAFGGSLGIGILIVIAGAACASVLGAIALVGLRRSHASDN
jgi:hypothetical protein